MREREGIGWFLFFLVSAACAVSGGPCSSFLGLTAEPRAHCTRLHGVARPKRAPAPPQGHARGRPFFRSGRRAAYLSLRRVPHARRASFLLFSYLQALGEYAALALDAHVLGPLDPAVEVAFGGRGAADACGNGKGKKKGGCERGGAMVGEPLVRAFPSSSHAAVTRPHNGAWEEGWHGARAAGATPPPPAAALQSA